MVLCGLDEDVVYGTCIPSRDLIDEWEYDMCQLGGAWAWVQGEVVELKAYDLLPGSLISDGPNCYV